MVHFCPTRLCCSAWLGENLSCCPSPLSSQELLLARLRRSYKTSCPSFTGEQVCSRAGARGVKLALLSPSLAYFTHCEAQKRQESFPRWENTPLERHNHPPAPKTSPLAPLPSLPPTHTPSVSCTHSQLGSRISGQRGRPENSRKHQKQLQRLFFNVCVRACEFEEFIFVLPCLKEAILRSRRLTGLNLLYTVHSAHVYPASGSN